MEQEGFTRAERLRRLRVLTAEARRVEDVARSCRVEVGSRTVPVRSAVVPVPDAVIAEDDDLLDFLPLTSAASDVAVSGPGMVVHLYLYGTPTGFGEYELTDVVTGWIGTADAEPQLVGRQAR